MGITNYIIRRALDAGFTSGVTDITVGNVLTYTDTGLAPLTTYYYKIKARDEAGNESLFSFPGISATTGADDAAAFLSAAGITDPTITSAIQDLVSDLKAASLWVKMVAAYPFVGGTAAAHKFNLKDPRDLDAAFRMTFSGGVVHNANGVTLNGTNGIGDTHLDPLSNLTNNHTHMSFYSRTSGASDAFDLGIVQAGHAMRMRAKATTGNYLSDAYAGSTDRINTAATDGLGLFTDTVSDASTHKAFRNATQLGSTVAPTGDISSVTTGVVLGEDGTHSAWSPRNFAWASVGTGLTSGEVASLNTIIQAFQTALSRNV